MVTGYISYYPMTCSTVHGTLYVNHNCPLERGANNDIHEAHGTLWQLVIWSRCAYMYVRTYVHNRINQLQLIAGHFGPVGLRQLHTKKSFIHIAAMSCNQLLLIDWFCYVRTYMLIKISSLETNKKTLEEGVWLVSQNSCGKCHRRGT